jgi:hypothetical protein
MAANDANEQTDPKATPAPDTAAEAANVADSGQANPPAVTVNIVQQDKNAEAAANMTAGRDLAMDTTTPGGKYLVNGQLTNANGDKPGTSLDKSST